MIVSDLFSKLRIQKQKEKNPILELYDLPSTNELLLATLKNSIEREYPQYKLKYDLVELVKEYLRLREMYEDAKAKPKFYYNPAKKELERKYNGIKSLIALYSLDLISLEEAKEYRRIRLVSPRVARKLRIFERKGIIFDQLVLYIPEKNIIKSFISQKEIDSLTKGYKHSWYYKFKHGKLELVNEEDYVVWTENGRVWPTRLDEEIHELIIEIPSLETEIIGTYKHPYGYCDDGMTPYVVELYMYTRPLKFVKDRNIIYSL